MTDPCLAKAYEPSSIEKKVNEQWLTSDAFKAKKADERYCIVIPPPNVTGRLHMGHAFSYTLQDILIRWQRLHGKQVLWQPGTDHAGIATQMVVERLLDKEGKKRRDMTREAFLERVWQWKEESGGTIVSQLKRLGASCDWSRERFTLDEGLSDAVGDVFVRLYKEGLIYRGKRLVNWDPVLETAVSDLEVEHVEEQGHFWHIRYPLADNPSESVIVATTRPETMLGDAAVAVHPSDERFKHLIGQEVLLPLTDRRIPIIADHYVDIELGTGCLKITPAHDFNDYEVGKRHDLPQINILNNQAHLLSDDFIPEKYRGMERYEAREHIVADLDAAGLLYRVEEHVHQVGRGDRSHAVLEPYLTDQWYVAIQELADPAMAAVKEGETRFVPAHWEKTYFDWMNNIQDWCISRQLWWGHRIPAWFCNDCDHITVSKDTPACCGGCSGHNIHQDEDVLDTWFSSALWPFSTLGWPANTQELEDFYSTNVLVTGFDIIFFWVARMMMMGLKFTDKVPFKDVYIHALIRDANGQKMSKSKGNVIDPLEMVDEFGADALRFTLTHMATPGRDVKLDADRIKTNRNFMNKIWNAARFVFMNRADAKPDASLQAKNDVNRWILHELQTCAEQVEAALKAYRFNDAAETLYHFIWGTYCDWYVEAAKVSLYGDDEADKSETQITMLTALDAWLKLLHPICPFISEAIWQELHGDEARLITHQSFLPDFKQDQSSQAALECMNLVMDVVKSVRSIRGEMNVNPGKRIQAAIACDTVTRSKLESQQKLICNLAKIDDLQWLNQDERLEDAAMSTLAFANIFLPLAGLINVEEELQRLAKKQVKHKKEVEMLEKKLANPRFSQNAPEAVVAKTQGDLDEHLRQLEEIFAAVERLERLK
ncbi:MAG: valine--tRNA ligase [Mariprofundaceae bacterium]|nr:valine--tRNA ligase [Mariprofundaceae bacterium]